MNRRGILSKSSKGQVMIVNMIFLVMTIVVFVSLIPTLREMMNNARHQDSLNCRSNINTCSNNSAIPCYNSSRSPETFACTMIDLYIPYIVIIVLIAGVAKIMANRVEMGFGGVPQQQYQQPY